MEILSIKKYNKHGIPDTVTQLVKNTEKLLDSSLTKFIDGITPVKCNYYTVDHLASITGIGDKTTMGPYSGATKYKVIKNYVGYSYPDEKILL